MKEERKSEFCTPNYGDLQNYVVGNQIGRGSYAVVMEAVQRKSGLKVAVKQYDRRKL